MTAIEELVVVIPANDEERLIGACLTALDGAVAHLRGLRDPLTVRVVVVLDDCSDRTADLVALWPAVETVQVEFRNVGAARRAGVERALAASGRGPGAVWIANSDADTRVPEKWLRQHLEFAESGGEVLVGSIRPDAGDLTAAQYRAWEQRAAAVHAADHADLHVYGANLGVRGDVYLALGGFSTRVVGEDVHLVTRALDAGRRVVSDDSCQVETSARTSGRAPGGYADYVRAHY